MIPLMSHTQTPLLSLLWNLSPDHTYMRGISNYRKLVSQPHKIGCEISLGRYMVSYTQHDPFIQRSIDN